MSSPWLTGIIIYKLFCITVVSADKELSVNLFDCLYSLSYTLINSLNSLDRSCLDTCVANHIRVCEVDDDHIIFIRFDCLNKFLANFRCAHLRLHVIGRNLRGFYKDSVLSLVRLLNATVEEESNVCVLLCLSDTCLCHIVNGILIRNGCNRFAVFLDHCRKYELIGLAIIIGSLNCCRSICSLYSFALCKSFVCKLYTIPAVITVHCIVTSGNHTDLTNADFFHLYRMQAVCHVRPGSSVRKLS